MDDAGLEAAVRIAKGDRRRHGAVAAEYASAMVSAAKRQLVLSLALSLVVLRSRLDQHEPGYARPRLAPPQSLSLLLYHLAKLSQYGG